MTDTTAIVGELKAASRKRGGLRAVVQDCADNGLELPKSVKDLPPPEFLSPEQIRGLERWSTYATNRLLNDDQCKAMESCMESMLRGEPEICH
jgi:hypothetical protein